MRGRAIIVLIAIFCVVNEVAAQSVVNRSDTLSLDYSPIDYVAVMEQLNRASQPTAWQRFSDWLFKKHDIEEQIDDKVEYINPVVADILGMPAEDVVGKNFLDFVNKFQRFFRKILATLRI